jgi:GNAT superfamily N-acetyltransferase
MRNIRVPSSFDWREFELEVKIIDVTQNDEYEKYFYKCLAPIPFTPYSRRREYLEKAIPRGFHKKLLTLNGDVVGQIEYAPAEASGYPMMGDGIIVMNCLWVLKKAKGHGFGRLLLEDMTTNEKDATGFATIALENHWSPWFKKTQMEKLGFKSIDSIEVAHETKHKGQAFTIYLMWMPMVKNAKPVAWSKQRFLEGVAFCLAHPLYHPQSLTQKRILRESNSNIASR